MLTPEKIYNQVNRLTADMIGLSLCDRQNFPTLRDVGQGYRKVDIGEDKNISLVLKNIHYYEIYTELDRTNMYNFRMLDGAIIQMMYCFKDNSVETYRLAFFPSPSLEEFQNNPEVYIDDEIYAEVVMKNIVPFPLRFDFDSRKGVATDVEHPASHLTLGQYKNCRIPVSAPITPYQFIDFILRNFYNTAFIKYSQNISYFRECFSDSITDTEKGLLHLRTPSV